MFLKCRQRKKGGKVHRTWSVVESHLWVMDRGIPTETVLEQMRASDPPCRTWWGQRRVGSPAPRFLRAAIPAPAP